MNTSSVPTMAAIIVVGAILLMVGAGVAFKGNIHF